MKKTDELLKELDKTIDIDAYLKNNTDNMICSSLAKYLKELLKEKLLIKSEVIKRSELNAVYAYQIFEGTKKPTANKVICLAMGMGLNLEETQRLLSIAKQPILYAKNKRDCMIIFAINNHYSVSKTNELLFEKGEDTLYKA